MLEDKFFIFKPCLIISYKIVLNFSTTDRKATEKFLMHYYISACNFSGIMPEVPFKYP